MIQLSGLPCFWAGQYQPPPGLLQRASSNMASLARIMKLPASDGTIALLQGEAIALLLKAIGNALSKDKQQLQQQAAATAAAADSGSADAGDATPTACEPGGQQQEQQQRSKVAADKLQCLRALVVLMHLLGEHLGSHALQVGASLVCRAAAAGPACHWVPVCMAWLPESHDKPLVPLLPPPLLR